ncbi:MAG: thiamine-phosphate kinase [Firmicutes bacterium]|nr:thiamine-phosphate kinase [Bacillota bacterium]
MRVGEIGEFGLIDRWMRSIRPDGRNAIVGIGDDAAVLEFPPGRVLVATCDMMVEGVHFILPVISPEQLGIKAMAMNLSDLAAMNARPLYALVSVGLKHDLEVEFVDRLYKGLTETALRHGCQIVGGDTVNSPLAFMVDVFLMGDAERGKTTLRSGARPGDLIMVTGTVGGSAAGLDLLLAANARGAQPAGEVGTTNALAGISHGAYSEVVTAHLEPRPRLPESRAISAAGGASAAIDISDGLANEVNHLARLSGVEMVVDASSIPLGDATREVARAMGKDPLDYALFGGEDYELCFTVRPELVEKVMRSVRDETGTPVSVIGRVFEGRGAWIIRNGRRETLGARAYDHFRSTTGPRGEG